MTEESLLADIARNDERWSLRAAAVARVTEQDVLANVAKNDENSLVRAAAVDYEGHIYTSVDSGATWTQRL